MDQGRIGDLAIWTNLLLWPFEKEVPDGPQYDGSDAKEHRPPSGPDDAAGEDCQRAEEHRYEWTPATMIACCPADACDCDGEE